jgi:hypothetical protein
MIQSRPKVSTLFSIGVFLLIAYTVFFYSMYSISTDYETWKLVLIFTSGPIAIAVSLKTLWGLKQIDITKERFSIKYPFRFSTYQFIGKDIESWELDKIKTYGGEYEELIWHTKAGKKYSISKQEHTDYDKTLNYMLKKFKRLKQ